MKTLGTTALTDFVGGGGGGEGLYEGETFAEAVERIGSTRTVLVIDEDLTVLEPVVIPATLKLKWMNGAMLVRGGDEGEASLEFEGNPFVDNQEMSMDPLFSGFDISDISFLPEASAVGPTAGPADVSSELADHPTNSLTTRLRLLTNWFNGKKLTFHCFSRPITDTADLNKTCRINDYHSLYFRKGVFDNTYTWGGDTAAFLLGSNLTFHSENGALIRSSVVNQSVQLINISGKNNTIVENNYFEGGGGNFDGMAFSVAISGASDNCHIRNNWANGVEAYVFGIASTPAGVPSWCTIDGNRIQNYSTQLIALIGGRHCKIINNIIDLHHFHGGIAYATFIDIEPNNDMDFIEDLEIAYNFIDMRDMELYNGHATGALTAVANPADGETILVNGVLFTFVSGASTASNVNIKGTKELTMGEFATVLSASAALAATIHPQMGSVTYTHAGAVVNLWGVYPMWGGVYSLANSSGGSVTASGAILDGGGVQYAMGIFVQGGVSGGHDDVWVHDNVFFADHNGQLQYGVNMEGSSHVTISGNQYEGYGNAIVVASCNHFRVFDNIDYSTNGGVMYVGNSGNGRIYNNYFQFPSALVIESNAKMLAHANGTNILTLTVPTGSAGEGRIFYSYIGQTIRYNVVNYTITDISMGFPNPTMTVNTTVPACVHSEIMPAAINTTTGVITAPSHGFNDGCLIQWYAQTAYPAGIAENSLWYIHRIDADTLTLHETEAAAIANTGITIPSTQGTGFQWLIPSIMTQFLNNRYSDNNFLTYNIAGNSYVTERHGWLTLNLPSIPANTVQLVTVTLGGARLFNSVMITPPHTGMPAGLLLVNAYVSADDTVTLTLHNTTGSAIDMGAADYWAYKLSQ